MATPDSDSSSNLRATEPEENSIRLSELKRKPTKAHAPEAERASTAPSSVAATSNAVPQEIAKRFVQVRDKYYFPDGARAFTDRGNRITTNSENTEVVRSLVGIAQARGWLKITVRGTERFREEAWFAASLAGLSVRGYKPSDVEQSRLVRTLAREKAAPIEPVGSAPGSDGDSVVRGAVGDESSPRSSSKNTGFDRGEPLLGKLIDHGRATYNHDPRAPMSYFVKLETPRGDRVIWGVDLERAFKESLTQLNVGDEVALRTVRQEAVKLKARDEAGKITGRDVETHRNRWFIEKREFFKFRVQAARTVRDTTVSSKQAVKQYPELVGTYLQVHAAELAARRFRDTEDRQLFVAKVRAALADSIANGEPLPAVRLRERAKARTPDPREREPDPARG
jgi:hypothetical protein